VCDGDTVVRPETSLRGGEKGAPAERAPLRLRTLRDLTSGAVEQAVSDQPAFLETHLAKAETRAESSRGLIAT
jgi:hypothetical protein